MAAWVRRWRRGCSGPAIDVSIWNRTRAKAETEELKGAKIVDARSELADVDVLFTMLNTGKDVADVCFGPEGMFRDGAEEMPKMLVDCSTIGMDELAEIRRGLDKLGVKFLAAPVSGNPKCVRAGKFCCVVSGPKDAYEPVKPLLLAIAPRGAAYAGEGELARMCKIAVNLLLAVHHREHDGGDAACAEGRRQARRLSASF